MSSTGNTLRELISTLSSVIRFSGIGFCIFQSVDTIKCQGPSMLPTLNKQGDIVLVDKLVLYFREVEKGEVVIAKSVSNPAHTVCKRVIAKAGDTVCVRPRYSSSDVEFHRIPKGHVWLEGDNKHDSLDSRYYGPVPAALIKGRVIMRIWPMDQFKWIEKEFTSRAFRER